MNATPVDLVLASTSRYRHALMQRLGVPFRAVAPECDERAHSAPSPRALAELLAQLKAESVDAPGALIIGSDQVVDLDGEVLGKPGAAEAAVDQLQRLSGRSHRLITSVCVHSPAQGRSEVATDVHTMWMRPLSRATLQAYVAHDQPLDCAGSYVLERRGVALFERIEADPETADDTAIIGLPMMKLLALLRGFGVDVLDG